MNTEKRIKMAKESKAEKYLRERNESQKEIERLNEVIQGQLEIIEILKDNSKIMNDKLAEIHSLSGLGCQTLHNIKYRG